VSFFSGADAYDRFMGRYSQPLAPVFADFAGIAAGMRVVDVGCGPGALTAELVARVGAENVAAADPTEGFVEVARVRNPNIDIRQATAEGLPFDEGSFDAALAQLVVHFMTDPVAGIRELARVTRTGGVVAACVWNMTGDDGPLAFFWKTARELDPSSPGESARAGSTAGSLTKLFREAGIADAHEESISTTVEHASFDDWWEPFLLGVGPVGVYVNGLDPERRDRLRERLRERLGDGPFRIKAVAWAARGTPA
jgi:SAM-dependent methyltransferase